MSEINNFEIIQNKLDALVDKIIQKENSDENFRITYAQILEKINTKMDVFSNGEDFERISMIGAELRNIINDRQDIVDSKFNAIKCEFENINDLLVNSLKTPELLASFDKIQNQIHYFSEEQENQKFTFNSIVSHIEKFGTLEETNETLKSNFEIIKEQNTIVNENINKQLDSLNTIIFSLKEFSESVNEDAEKVKDFVSEKVNSIINKIQETDSYVEILNNNFTTLVQVVGNIFEDEAFLELKSDVSTIKDFSEKTFFQGTEVLKEEIWSIKDTVGSLKENSAGKEEFNQIAVSIEDLRKDISDIILNEQNEQIMEALQNLQTKFVAQLVQIADNISFAEEAEEINDNIFNCSDEIKEKISTDILDIKHEILHLKDVSGSSDESIISLLDRIDSAIKTDINNDLKTLIAGFKMLTSGLQEDKDYIYTLPDIESDLSKIRLDINNIQQVLVSTGEINEDSRNDVTAKMSNIKSAIEKLENSPMNEEIAHVKSLFDNLNDDISSISKRTNKLILTSDEVNKTLKNNVNAFSQLMNKFEKQSGEFYNSAFVNELNTKINKVTKTTDEILKSDEVLTEAFSYLGEWIDEASDSFDEIKTDVSKIKRNLFSDEENVSEKIERNVKTLAQKVEEQDLKINAIDEKLNRLLAQQNETKELKSLVEYVASQVSVTNEKIIENDKLNAKITSMEKQLKKIEKNVAIITEYLDEEEDSFDEED